MAHLVLRRVSLVVEQNNLHHGGQETEQGVTRGKSSTQGYTPGNRVTAAALHPNPSPPSKNAEVDSLTESASSPSSCSWKISHRHASVLLLMQPRGTITPEAVARRTAGRVLNDSYQLVNLAGNLFALADSVNGPVETEKMSTTSPAF